MEIIKKYWKWIVGILFVLLIMFSYWRYNKKQAFYERVKKIMEIGIFEEESFNEVDFETTNTIYNSTEHDFYDDVVKVGLRELGIDSNVVVIRPITQEAKDKFDINSELRAHILPNGPTGDNFIIWIDDMGKYESIVVLSHELIHLMQYQTKQIEIIKDGVIWEGEKYSYQEVQDMDYRQRPWEVDAFSKDKKLKLKMEDVLYGKPKLDKNVTQ